MTGMRATTLEPGSRPAGLPADPRRLQHRIVGTLILAQTIGGTGVAIGISVGALLAARMGGTAISGLGQSALVVGAALLAIPVTRLMTRRGRRPGLGLAYVIGAVGAGLVLLAAARESVPLLFVGLFLFGGGNTGGFQSRYAAVDLAQPERRGRQLSLVVWAAAIGSITGPNLAPLADESLRRFGVATYAGPFLYSGVAFLLAAAVILVALRPDPLLTARALAAAEGSGTGGEASADTSTPARSGRAGRTRDKRGLRAAAREVAASPGARLGVAAMAVGHLVMIAVMAMTPVHIDEAGHGDTLRIVGFVLSAHIAGMYALAPVTGWLTDRLGRRPVVIGGVVLLVSACAIAGLSGHHTGGLTIGLFLLGMGWSGTMVAGSTLLTESVGLDNRASVQGLADMVTGVGGAVAAALAGVVVAWSSYAVLTAAAAVATVPLLAAALRPVPPLPPLPAVPPDAEAVAPLGGTT
jgi:MFS family permease